jgi:2-polyprenyl-3-methyl-5-hydroxy-6-metoxy-1,4-benzoquinol methylase
MKDVTQISECRLCKNSNIKTVLPFGEVALANSYPQTIHENEDLFNLTLVKCDDCGHVQLKETINPDRLFLNYLYSSSDSPSLVKHFAEYAQDIKNRFNYNTPTTIIDIGSNDGILLKEFENINFGKLIGIDPAENISERAKSIKDATIIVDFFNITSSQKIKDQFGPINIICANNVFAHVDKIDSMVEGIANIMDDNSVFVFENAYLLDTIKGLYFDQAYHEHLQYYGIIPLVKYLKRYDLEIFDIKRVNTQGGSFRIFTKKTSSVKHKITENVQAFIDKENEFNLYADETYVSFVNKLNTLKTDLQALIKTAIAENKTISCYGCPAKFALFSKFFELNSNIIKYVVDDSSLKQGRFSPGKKIPIVSKNYFYENPTDYCIISVWNMADAIVNNNKDYKGKFIVPMPELKVI